MNKSAKPSKLALAIFASMTPLPGTPGCPPFPPDIFQKKCLRAIGLRQCIAQAGTEEEILSLLKEGSEEYIHASEKTRRSWQRTAKLQLVKLKSKGSNVVL